MWKHFQGRSPWRLWSLYKRTWQLLNWHWEWLNKSDVFWWENQIYLNTECWRHPAFLGKGRYLTFLKAGWRDMASSNRGEEEIWLLWRRRGKELWYACAEGGGNSDISRQWLKRGSQLWLILLNCLEEDCRRVRLYNCISWIWDLLFTNRVEQFLTVSNNIYVILFMVDYCIKFIALTNFLHL